MHRAPSFVRHTSLLLAALLCALVAVMGGALPAAAATAHVDVVDNTFAPGQITVLVGDTVKWTWYGDAPHSVSGGAFDSHPDCSPLATEACGLRGATFSVTFTEAGSTTYRCKVHAGMVGSVSVAAPPQASPSSPQPSPSPSPSDPAPPLPTETAEPEPTPAPTTSAAPSTAPPAPSPSQTAAPQPSPTPSPSPSPSPTPVPVGPPTEPVVDNRPSAPPEKIEAAEGPGTQIQAFPEAPEPSDIEPTVETTVAAVEIDTPGSGRGIPIAIASATLLGTVAALGKFVLFAPPW